MSMIGSMSKYRTKLFFLFNQNSPYSNTFPREICCTFACNMNACKCKCFVNGIVIVYVMVMVTVRA